MQHETEKQHLEDLDHGVHRRVVFTKLLSSKIAAVVKQMQEHLEKTGIKDSLEVKQREGLCSRGGEG